MQTSETAPQQQLDPGRIVRLRNDRCPYCFSELSNGVIRDVDHVIGRQFVPSGALSSTWNLLVRSCRACNAAKAKLEADISSITLHQLAFGVGRTEDAGGDPVALLTEVRRKGRTRSPVTGRFVAESETRNVIKGRFGPAAMGFTLDGPPQLDPDRALQLAAMHVRGLATLIFAGNRGEKLNYLPGTILLCAEAGRSDWGTERARGFMEMVRNWPRRLTITGAASGFFHAMIRKEPGTRPIWAWALEWNRQHRSMGFMGDVNTDLIALSDTLPEHVWTGRQAYDDPERCRVIERWRIDADLPPDADDLFA